MKTRSIRIIHRLLGLVSDDASAANTAQIQPLSQNLSYALISIGISER